VRNREALLCAGRRAFAEHGLEVPLDRVAQDAGVAIGTLYRHFPSRLDLVRAIFDEKLAAWLAAAEQAVQLPDAWEGFVTFAEVVCGQPAEDRAFGDLTTIRVPGLECLEGSQLRIRELASQIIERAQLQGALRADLTPEDLAVVVWANSGVIDATIGISDDAWRRHLHLLLDGFRADRAHPLPSPPLTSGQVHVAMLRLGGAGPCGGSGANA
jgi:AcrR family transcriptional regulator